MIKFSKSNRRYENGKLLYQSISGWHDMESKCVRNVGRFKVFAVRIECAVAYTNYYVADTESGEVVEYRDHPSYMGSALTEIIEQVKERGLQ